AAAERPGRGQHGGHPAGVAAYDRVLPQTPELIGARVGGYRESPLPRPFAHPLPGGGVTGPPCRRVTRPPVPIEGVPARRRRDFPDAAAARVLQIAISPWQK